MIDLLIDLHDPSTMACLACHQSTLGFFLLTMASAACHGADALAAPPPSAASRLRSLIAPPGNSATDTTGGGSVTAVALPGVHDALSAKIFADAGASALFLSGFGVSACRLGEPDAGILTLAEMEDAARSVVAAAGGPGATGVPVIVDGDTGYGGASNLRRTVRGLAAAGAAAVTIEDQKFPKRCTYAAGAGVRVVSREQSVERIRAAVGARDEARDRDGHDVLIVARTDCRAALGFEEAVERCKAYEALGADVVYAENLQSKSEYMKLRESLAPSTPMMLAQVQQGPGGTANGSGDDQNVYTVEEVGEMGYSLALFGVTALQATVHALQRTASSFLRSGEGRGCGVLEGDAAKDLASFSELKKVVGFPELEDWEGEYNIDT